MKATLHFSSAEDLRRFLQEIGVPEQTTGKMETRDTFGEFTEAQVELARSEFGAEVDAGPDG